MKLIVTGGGTGGHVFPALEVAKFASNRQHDVSYWGSLRGQEVKASDQASIPFMGFRSGPVYSVRTLEGVKAALQLLICSSQVVAAMRKAKPDMVFGTGGYSSAPLMLAVKRLKVPHVIHEQNSVPGRTQLMAAKTARAVCTVFLASAKYFDRANLVRTGMPVRRAFYGTRTKRNRKVLVTGGSQGSARINECVRQLSERDYEISHVVGRGRLQVLGTSLYVQHEFLDADAMAGEMSSCSVCVSRSGAGTVSELVATRTPAILIPYPQAFGNHQVANAKEMEDIGIASTLAENELSTESLSTRILEFLGGEFTVDEERCAEWDAPDATANIVKILEDVVADAQRN